MKRRSEPPRREELVQDAVDAVLDGEGPAAGASADPFGEVDRLSRSSRELARRPRTSSSEARVEDLDEDELPNWADKFVRVLDDGVRIPGTQIRFGLDAILGFFLPTVGDVVTGASSVALLFLALRERVPTVAIGRMLINIFLDTVIGSIPFVGDLFDVFFRANRRNLEIIERYHSDPDASPSVLDYALVVGGLLLIVLSIALPFVFAGMLAELFTSTAS
jgi:hypothetical protein